MDVREKLVDDVHSKLMGLLQRAPYIRCEDVHRQYAVNWLMNNGVTVQEWIPASDPPKRMKPVICLYENHDGTQVGGGYVNDHGIWTLIAPARGMITHWIPMPAKEIKCHNCNGTDEPEHYRNKKYCPNCGARVGA